MIEARREPTFEDAGNARQRARPPGGGASAWLALAAVVLLVVAGLWLLRPRPERVAIPPQDVARPVPDVADSAQAPVPAASLRHVLPPADPAQLVQAEGVAQAITRLVGRDAALRFLQLTDFPRRAVATLDGLGREHAPVPAWPVVPTPERFVTEAADGAQVISERNAGRYAPFVAFVGSLDAAAVVDLYRRLYPVLQQAYRDLGFGDRSLNDRVLEVLALLLATPEPRQPLAVTLTEVKGSIPSLQPWTRYQFADPELQRLAAGQKILLRVGADNRAVLQRKLRELQAELLRVSAAVPVRP